MQFWFVATNEMVSWLHVAPSDSWNAPSGSDWRLFLQPQDGANATSAAGQVIKNNKIS